MSEVAASRSSSGESSGASDNERNHRPVVLKFVKSATASTLRSLTRILLSAIGPAEVK